MERPQPTIELILTMTGGNQGLVRAAHHGLYEVPLNGLYTDLNLDEVIAFAAASWQWRRKDLAEFIAPLAQLENIYQIFNMVNQRGFPWLNKNKHIPEELTPLYETLNPYRGRTLEARLGRAEPEAVQALKEKLQGPVGKYPSKKTGEYAAEVAEMISGYPIEYEPLTAVKPQTPGQQIPLPF